MLRHTGTKRPPVLPDRQPDREPLAAVKFAGKVGDFVAFEVTAYLNQGLTDDLLLQDAELLVRDAVAVLHEELQKRWPEHSASAPNARA